MKTRRQLIAESLRDSEMSFEDLRQLFGLSVNVLEEDLRHLERSLAGRGDRLSVEPARCRDCETVLRRRPGRFATPSRCPSCRGRNLEPPRLSVG